jgi:hypothetical protein
MYSQYRAPRAAYLYLKYRLLWMQKYANYPLSNSNSIQRVYVLNGGFKQWISDYILESELVGNFNSKYWDEEFFPLTGRELFYNNDWKPHNPNQDQY